MPVHLEPFLQRLGDHLSHSLGVSQFRDGGRADGVHAPEAGGQRSGGGGADVPDGQCHQDPPQRLLYRRGQVLQQFGAVGSDATAARGIDGAAGQVVLGEREQPRLVGEQSRLQKVPGSDRPQGLDIEGTAGGERV